MDTAHRDVLVGSATVPLVVAYPLLAAAPLQGHEPTKADTEMVWEFNNIVIDPVHRQLHQDGRELVLQPLLFDLLLYFAANPGVLVTKDALTRDVWGGVIVGGNAIAQAVSKLRRTLHTGNGSAPAIRTVWGRGYRFVADVRARVERPAAGATAPPGRTPLVGRRGVTELLDRALEEARRGVARVVLLSGEPGIGKTRLAEEIATRAVDTEALVLWGRSWETGGAPAFWPWVQVFRSYGAEIDDTDLQAVVGPAAEPLSVIVPELSRRLGEDGSPPPQRVEQSGSARFLQFDAIVGCIARAATRRPLVLVFDDLHAADLPSLQLLGFLCSAHLRVPLLLVGTHRDAELRRRPDAVRILADVAHAGVRVSLRGLDEDEVADFLSSGFGVRVDAQTTRVVQAATDGNPFLLGELARAAAVDHGFDHLPHLGERRGLSERARALTRRRLDLLSEAEQRLLRVASLIGLEFSVRTLARASRLPEDQVVDRLHTAVADGLIVADALAPPHFRFRHALLREAIAAELTTAEYRALHRAIGEAIETQHADLLEPHFGRLAHHFAQAAPGGPWERAVRYARAAGEQAAARFAYEEAAAHFERALSTLDLADRPVDAVRCELGLALGTCRQQAGDPEAARRVLGEAASIGRALGRSDLLAQVAMAYEPWTAYGRTTDHGVRLLEEALVAQPEGDNALRAELLGHLAHVLGGAGGDRALGRAIALGWEAVAMARRLGEKRTLARALDSIRWVDWDPASFGRRVAIVDEMASLATDLRDPELALLVEGWRFADQMEGGEAPGAHLALGRHATLALELRQPEHRWWNGVWRTAIAVAEGRFADAEALCGEALDLGQRVSVENALLVAQMQLGQLMIDRGHPAEALSAFDALVADHHEALEADPAVGCRRAQLLAGSGDRVAARREFERIAGNDFAALAPDMAYALGLAALSITCAALDDQPRAAVLYRRISSTAERNLMLGPAIVFAGPAARFQGLLAGALRRHELACRHFEDALAMNRRMGWLPSLAHTLCDYADARIREGSECPSGQTRTMLGEALEIAERLGMPAVAQRAAGLLDQIDSASTARRVATGTNVWHRQGTHWRLSYGKTSCRVRHVSGLRYLAELLRRPGCEISVHDLVTAVDDDRSSSLDDPVSITSVRISDGSGESLGVPAPVTANDPPRPPAAALAGAERRTDAAEVEHPASVRNASDRTRAAVAGGGTMRRVSGAIRRAIAHIHERHPELGRHLTRYVRLGNLCAYRPDRRHAVLWSVRIMLWLVTCSADWSLGVSESEILDL